MLNKFLPEGDAKIIVKNWQRSKKVMDGLIILTMECAAREDKRMFDLLNIYFSKK